MTGPADRALILVIEDQEDLRRDIVEELHDAGYRTLAAEDGRQALEMLAHNAPDLLLCDITMPGLDGYDVLRALRNERPELSTTPFVFLTALSEPREVVEGKLQGADDYLVKPVDFDLMLATIEARLRQVHRIRSRHDDELRTLRSALDGLTGDGPAAALDLIALGAVLLDARGRPVHVNRAARDMGAGNGCIRIARDGVRAPDALSDRALQQAIARALEAARDDRERTVGVMLRRAGDDDTVPALVCALPPGAGTGHPRAALFIATPERTRQVPEALLIDLFDLTPTEARVAAALARGSRTGDVAAELGVSQTTISFHMRNLFQKTGTNRQVDLIALILAGPMMIEAS